MKKVWYIIIVLLMFNTSCEISPLVEMPTVINGIDGKDGRDGIDGINGINGEDGQDGVDGQDGADGTDGVDGQDGEDGEDGVCESCYNKRICIKDPSDLCHYNYTTINCTSEIAYNYYMGIEDDVNNGDFYQYYHRSFDTPEGSSCDDFDCQQLD